MYKVDLFNGKDIESNEYGITFQTLGHAIKIAKTGDNIMLMPGFHKAIDIKSNKKHFECKIKGVGYNSICENFIFNGFFDFSFEEILLQKCIINSACSDYHFKNVKFAGMNEMVIRDFPDKIGE